MRKELIQTLLPAKIEKFKYILDWAEKHCNKEQLNRFNEVLNEHNTFLVGYPFHGQLNVEFETDLIEPLPDKKDLMGTEKEAELLKQQRDKRKKIINSLENDIHTLNEYITEAEQQCTN